MKKQSTTLFTQMSAVQLNSLTTVVKETLASDFDSLKSKVFTAADLWNIQRQGKTRAQRRNSF